MALTRILLAANSCAKDFVKFNPAARMTLVGSAPAFGALPPPMLALTMAPPPRAFIIGIASRDKRTAAMTLRLKSDSHRSSSTKAKPIAADAPALLIKISMPP